MLAPPPFEPMRIGAQVGYASGNLGKSVLWTTLNLFFLFILTELWGLPPALGGLIILISLVFDGLAAPIMGYFADRTQTRFGKYAPYLLLGAPLCAASFWLLFQHTGGSPQAFWSILTLSLIFRACYTICDVPHNAMFARICETPEDAGFISGTRFFFSSAGALLVAIGAGWALGAETEDTQLARIGISALGAGLVFVVAIWVSALATWRADRRASEPPSRLDLRVAIALTLQNRMLLWLFALVFVQSITLPLFAKCLAYFGKYVQDDSAWSSSALIALTIAQGVSMPIWIGLTQWLGKTAAILTAYGLFGAGMTAFYFAQGIGLAPPVLAVFALIGAAIGGVNMALWAFLPDAIAAGKTSRGHRVEALATGVFLLMLKCGAGFGGILLGTLLDTIGLDGTNPLDDGFSTRLALLMCITPALGALVCALVSTRLVRQPRKINPDSFK